jgi:hypothetical protein
MNFYWCLRCVFDRLFLHQMGPNDMVYVPTLQMISRRLRGRVFFAAT